MLLLTNLFVILGVVVAALTIPDSVAKKWSIIVALVLGVVWLAWTVYISEDTPAYFSKAASVASNIAQSEVFHLIVALCIGAVGGWLLHSRFGRGKVVATKQASELDWKSSYDVLDLANASKMIVWREATSKLFDMDEHIYDLQARMNSLEEQRALAPLEKLTDSASIAELTAKKVRLMEEQRQESRANDALYHDIVSELHKKLRSGELVAQGFLMPVSKDSPDPIPATLWRILKLDSDFMKAQGENKYYVGVEIAKAQTEMR
jgi:hypothetical protein